MLDLKNCPPHKGQKTGIYHSLKVVVVHKGGSVDKGHYVVYIQPSEGKSWALFDDHTVKWVKEEEVLLQEASLLIYSHIPPPILFVGMKANQLTVDTGGPLNTTAPYLPTLHGRNRTETVSPGSREEHPDQPDNSPPMSGGNDQHVNRKAHARSPHTPTVEQDQVRKQRVLQQFQDALRKKLARSSTKWTPLSTITQWLSGKNRQRPCTILSNLDAHKIQTWIGQEQDIASYIKSCSFILWEQEINDVLLSLRPSRTAPTVPHLQPSRDQQRVTTPILNQQDESRRVIVPSSIGLPKAPRTPTSIKDYPTDTSWEESKEARLNLLDYLVQLRNITVQEEEDPIDQEKWIEQRLRHNVKGILRDISPPTPLPEQLYRQVRKWFQDSKVGQFQDRLNNLARQPEFLRTSSRASTRICINNTSARSKQILLARVKDTGITLQREDQTEFDVNFRGKSRKQSAESSSHGTNTQYAEG